jgi:hypothetical protein
MRLVHSHLAVHNSRHDPTVDLARNHGVSHFVGMQGVARIRIWLESIEYWARGDDSMNRGKRAFNGRFERESATF